MASLAKNGEAKSFCLLRCGYDVEYLLELRTTCTRTHVHMKESYIFAKKVPKTTIDISST